MGRTPAKDRRPVIGAGLSTKWETEDAMVFDMMKCELRELVDLVRRTTEWECRFNRSMQHTRICASSGGVANEAEAEDLLF